MTSGLTQSDNADLQVMSSAFSNTAQLFAQFNQRIDSAQQGIASAWQDEASRQFQMLTENFQQKMNVMRQQAEAMAEKLGTTTVNYDASRQDNTTASSAVISALDGVTT